MARNFELLQCFANDFFGHTIAVSIGCIPCVEATVVGSFEELQSLSVEC